MQASARRSASAIKVLDILLSSIAKANLKFNLNLSESDRLRFELKIYLWHPPPHSGCRGGRERIARRKVATTIDTATAEEDVKDFGVPGKKSDRV